MINARAFFGGGANCIPLPRRPHDGPRVRFEPSVTISGVGEARCVASGAKQATTWRTRSYCYSRVPAIGDRLDRRVLHQHDMQPARSMSAEFQRLLDIGGARGTGDEHDVAGHL